MAATANRWNLHTGGDLDAESVLPIDPVNLQPLDVPTRLANRASQPAIAAPAPPQGLTAMRIGDRQIELYWDSVNGVSQWGTNSYNIYTGSSPALLISVGGPRHTWTITQLTPATAYTIRVSAVGPGGESALSSPLVVTTLAAQSTPAIPPNAATGLVEVVSAADGVLTLRWNAVGATPPVTSYKISDGITVRATVNAPTTTGAINVVPGANFAATIRATNSAGDGPPSNPALTGVMPAATSAPAQITGLALNTAVTTTTIPLTWTADPKAQTYKVFDGATLKATVTAPATTVTLTGYTAGTAFSLTVKGSNATGDGTASTALTGNTAAVPAAPTGFALNTAATTTTIPLIWNAVTTATPAVTSYKIYDGATLKATITAPTVTATLTGYTTGTAYSLTVKSTNAIGDSVASTALTGSTA